MSIKVDVEVTEEIIPARSDAGSDQQVVYVDVGGRYPEKDSIWVNNNRPKKPGKYIADRLYKDHKKYVFALDLNNLTPVKAA